VSFEVSLRRFRGVLKLPAGGHDIHRRTKGYAKDLDAAIENKIKTNDNDIVLRVLWWLGIAGSGRADPSGIGGRPK
jgi:hypothetical protein